MSKLGPKIDELIDIYSVGMMRIKNQLENGEKVSLDNINATFYGEFEWENLYEFREEFLTTFRNDKLDIGVIGEKFLYLLKEE